MEPELEGQKLLPYAEIIKLAKQAGVSFGKGYPYNRLRYYTKIGLLPRAQRRSFGGSPEGCYPDWVVDTLVEIDQKLKEGKSIQAILREQKPESQTSAPANLEPATFYRAAREPLSLAAGVYQPPTSDTLDLGSSVTGSHPVKFIGGVSAAVILLLIILGSSLVTIYNLPPTHENGKAFINSLKPKPPLEKISDGLAEITGDLGSILGRATSPFLKINVETEIGELLNAAAGIVTGGADANLRA